MIAFVPISDHSMSSWNPLLLGSAMPLFFHRGFKHGEQIRLLLLYPVASRFGSNAYLNMRFVMGEDKVKIW